MVKDWFLDQGYTGVNDEGRLFPILLAMTDRAYGANSYKTTGFDPKWGGGRFQMRFMSSADNGTPFSWETYANTFYTSGTYNYYAFGTGAEPSTLNQLKTYMVFFEDDATNGADITLATRTNNCGDFGGSSSELLFDGSYDSRKLNRFGTNARSVAICTQVRAWHVPSGESRRAHVFTYYSGATSMR